MSEQKLSERVSHDQGCNSVFRSNVEPTKCDCWVSDLAALEAKLEAMERVLSIAKRMLYEAAENAGADDWGAATKRDIDTILAAAQQELGDE